MKKSIMMWSMVLSLMSVAWMHEAQSVEKQKEPQVQVSEEEMEKDVKDEEGLTRLGNFGKLHLFGYGELHYNGKIGPTDNEIDFHRMVLGVGYDFTDRIKLHTEVDFEHAFKEPELEFAYIDFLYKPWLNFRAGSLLVPMGVINERHEPPLFYSVERPELYRVIIPTTWQEGGAGVHGKLPGGFDYQLYVMTTPKAVGTSAATSFSGSNGLRGGRGRVGSQVANSMGGVARVQYTGFPGLRVGSSAFLGGTGHSNPTVGTALLTMVEGDAKYSFEGIDLEGALAYNHLSNAAGINTALAAAPISATSNFVGSSMLGWYLEGAYHLFHHLWPSTKHDLVVFGRYEDFDTQFKMPTGFAGSAANDRRTMTTGISYLPIPQVALKADYMANWNMANGGVDQFNMGLGFYY